MLHGLLDLLGDGQRSSVSPVTVAPKAEVCGGLNERMNAPPQLHGGWLPQSSCPVYPNYAIQVLGRVS
jgi:hypothetical protein